MSTPLITFVQARMSSRRFPGKVLAPFRGQPIIRHVIDAVREALPSFALVVVTSAEPSDDPLAAYVSGLDVPVFRGALADVFGRFRDCLEHFPCDWVLRVSGDSPLIAPRLIKAVTDHIGQPVLDFDLVTTVYPRTFPKGQNAELIRAEVFQTIDAKTLTDEEKEHVTPYFYRHPDRFRIVNVSSGSPKLAAMSLAIDSLQDLERLEALADVEVQALAAAFQI